MVPNIQKALKFYTEVLNFELIMSSPVEDSFEWAAVRKDSIQIFFLDENLYLKNHPELEEQRGSISNLYIMMEGLNQLYTDIKEHVNVIWPPKTYDYGITEFTITDEFGNIITFAEEDK